MIGDKQQPNGAEQGEAREGPSRSTATMVFVFFYNKYGSVALVTFVLSRVPWHTGNLHAYRGVHVD